MFFLVRHAYRMSAHPITDQGRRVARESAFGRLSSPRVTPVSGVRRQIRLGRIQRLWSQEFLSLFFIGFAIGALALMGAGHGGSPLPVGDKVIALVVAGSLLAAGALGAWRCRRLAIELDHSEVRVRGIYGHQRVPLADIAFIGYGSTLLARSLYFVSSDGHATIARGVSYQGRTAPPEANEVVNTIRTAAEAVGADMGRWTPDPLPNLPDVPLEPSDRPPPEAFVEPIELGAFWRANFKSLTLAEAVVIFVAVGVQAGFPRTSPWIVLAVVGLLLAYSAFTIWFARKVSRRLAPSVAYSGSVIAIGTAGKWKAIDLDRLAGLGGEWLASSPGFFGSTFIVTRLRFVDVEGHRLDFDASVLPQRLLDAVTSRLDNTVQLTAVARHVLQPQPPTQR